MGISKATKVGERVYLLDTFALGQAGTVSVYVVKGPKVTLIDCGYASSYKTVLEGLAELGVPPSEVRYVVPTHVHLDHAGAAGFLLKEMPNAQVLAHEKAVKHLVDPSRLIESATQVFGKFIMELYGLPIPIEKERITPVGDEARLDLGGGLEATVTYAPGHAPHQIALMVERERILFTADAVGIVYPNMRSIIPTTPPPSFEPEKLVDTVNVLRQMDSRSLLVPHFGVRRDVSSVFEATRRKTMEWLEKVRSLKNDGRGFDEIVEVMQEVAERDAGVARGALPIYAQVSIRTTVMGMFQYLEKA